MIEQVPPTQNNPANPANGDVTIDLGALLSVLYDGKWIIALLTLTFSIASVIYALSLPNVYKSTAILAASESSDSAGLAGLAGNLGGLASLAGVSLGGNSSNAAAEALEILKSWAFIEEFIDDLNISSQVFAVEDWDSKTNQLIYNPELFDVQENKWVRDPSGNKGAAPSSWELYERFTEYLSIVEDKASGFTTIRIEYYSPFIAKEWVDALVTKINRKIQVRDATESERNINFLKEQIKQTPLASMQSVFYELIEEQTKTLMLAKGNSEYVFRTVSESRVAEEKSGPKRALICIFGAMLGAVLGCVIALIRGSKRIS